VPVAARHVGRRCPRDSDIRRQSSETDHGVQKTQTVLCDRPVTETGLRRRRYFVAFDMRICADLLREENNEQL